MDTDRWRDVSELFERAADLPPSERPALLDAEAGDDPALREEVERLLAFDAGASGPLDRPALGSGPPPDAGPPPEAGPWRLAERVGRGGMGEVWRAERPIGDDGLRQTAAVKLVRPGLDDIAAVRFRSERRILAGLDHPAIARLLGGGTASDGRPYLATEFVDGEPVTAFADRRRLGVNERLALFVDVCEAVAFAHARLVVHRDLKPSNVLVAETDEGPRVKLLDFGIAKLLDDDDGLRTRTGRSVLTPAYAAPEQVAGGPVTTATDVYGLGVLLYELLTGARPAPGGDATRPSDAVTTSGETAGRVPPHPARAANEGGAAREGADGGGAAPDTSALRSTTAERLRRRLRGDLDRICLKALRVDPARRYRGAGELGADVRRHLGGLPVEARPESRAYRVGKFVRRNRALVAAAAVALLAVVGGAGAALWQAAEAEAERDRATAVSDFLTDLFTEADPQKAQGDTLTVYDLLALGAERADTLAGQPRTQAELLRVLGRTYAAVGQPALGDSLLVLALDALRRSGAPAEDVARVLDDRSGAAYDLGDAVRSETFARRGLALDVRDPSLRGRLLGSLGAALQEQADYGGAEAVLTEAVAVDPAPFASADALVQLSSALGGAGAYDEATAVLERAIPTLQREVGPRHPTTVEAHFNLANVFRLSGRPGEAEPIYRDVLSVRRDVYGPDHLATLGTVLALGMTLKDLEDPARLDEAAALLGDALATLDRVAPPDHPLTSTAVYALAGVEGSRGELAEAERLFRRSVALDRAALGDHPYTALTLNALGALLRKRGRFAEAERSMREALAIQEAALPPDHLDPVATRGNLGDVLRETGRFAEAEELYLRYLDDVSEAYPDGHPNHRRARRRLASLYEAWGRPDNAERYRTGE